MKITMKSARVNRNLTQKQAAELIGVSSDIISNWERGISFPTVIQIESIEKAYQVSYNDINFLPSATG